MKKTLNTILKIVGVLLALAAVAGACYLVYKKFFARDYDEEFIDELDDEFDEEDFFEDEASA